MFRNFREMENHLLSNGIKKTIVLANAQDDVALEALVRAKKVGIVDAILIGDTKKIESLLESMNENRLEQS